MEKDKKIHMDETKILEITLISAQSLVPPSANIRRLQTYAVLWIDSSKKLRTGIDRVGNGDPIWNDKFLFKVGPEFLCSETSAVSVEIFAVGYLRDRLIGTVRLLMSNIPLLSPTEQMRTPSFVALQIRRPSGRFQGLLNICAIINDSSDLPSFKGTSAISCSNFVKETDRSRRGSDSKSSIPPVEDGNGGESCYGDSGGDLSDGADSTSSTLSATSTALKDLNGIRDLMGINHLRSSSDGGLFCGLRLHRKLPMFFSAQNLQEYAGSPKEN